MNLTKYNQPKSVKPAGLFDNFLDDLFNSSMSDWMGNSMTTSNPSINIIEEKDAFLVEVASPGLEKSDFDIKIDNDQLIISATKEQKSEEKKENYTRREFNFSSFERSFYLPDSVDAAKVEANYNDGILRIRLNKKAESVKIEAKSISIK
jgi:HSP20 family protein